MNIKANTALLSCLLLVAPALFADHDKGKKEKRDDDEKIERKVKVDRGEDRVKIERRERDDEEEMEVERRVQVARPAVVQKRIVRVNNDVNRLEAILATAQNNAIAFPRPTLTRVANEANMLANRIVANVRAARLNRRDALMTASTLRMHIREMHRAAARGDAAGVRTHAGEALSFAVRLDNIV